MANQEQVDLLKQGVDIWNAWRDKNPEVKIDLSNAELVEANLSSSNLNDYLHDYRYEEAQPTGINLSGADLRAVLSCMQKN